MEPTLCAPSRRTNERRSRSILPSTILSPATTNAIDESAKRGWEFFNTRAVATNATLCRKTKRDVTFFTDNDFHNIGIGIIRHNVVALARQAEQLIKSGNTEAIDRAAIGTDYVRFGPVPDHQEKGAILPRSRHRTFATYW